MYKKSAGNAGAFRSVLCQPWFLYTVVGVVLGGLHVPLTRAHLVFGHEVVHFIDPRGTFW